MPNSDSSLAAAIATLNAAKTESELTTALADAKANGFSNKHEAFKHAKRRLYSLSTGEALEELVAKEAAKKRKRSFDLSPEELAQSLVGKPEQKDKSGAGDPSNAGDETLKKRKRKKLRANADPAAQPDTNKPPAPDEQKHKASQDSGRAAIPDKPDAPKFQVRVARFPFSEDEDALKEFFGKCGFIQELVLLRDPKGKSRAVAFVTYARAAGLKAALKLDGEHYGNSSLPLKVGLPKTAREDHEPGKDASHDTKDVVQSKEEAKANLKRQLFVGGLHYAAQEETVRQLLEACGELETFFMPVNKDGRKKGQCKGFAIVTYKDQGEAVNKAFKLSGVDFEGQPLIVKRRNATQDKDSSAEAADAKPEVIGTGFEVFAGGLFSIARKVIKKHFAECGEIASFELPLTPQGESKGIAFISYKTLEGMQNAMDLNETKLGKRWLTVQKKVSKDPKD